LKISINLTGQVPKSFFAVHWFPESTMMILNCSASPIWLTRYRISNALIWNRTIHSEKEKANT